MSERPLIVRLALDQGAFDWFDDLRRAWFPPERNQVPAHLTLFHALPGAELEPITETLRALAAKTPPMTLRVTGPRSLGNGVAYRMEAPALGALHAKLSAAFAPWLTRQDRQPLRPHITVQNKASPDAARDLLERLQAEFEAFDVLGEGVSLWRYLGGPWEPIGRAAFTGAPQAR